MTIWNFNFPGAGLYSTDPDDFAMNGMGHTDSDGVLDFDTGNTIYAKGCATCNHFPHQQKKHICNYLKNLLTRAI